MGAVPLRCLVLSWGCKHSTSFICLLTGHSMLGVMPSISQLAAVGVLQHQVISSAGSNTSSGGLPASSSLPVQHPHNGGGGSLVSSPPTLPAVVSTHQASVSAMPSSSGNKHVLVAPGLPCLSQKIIDRIIAGEYIVALS